MTERVPRPGQPQHPGQLLNLSITPTVAFPCTCTPTIKFRYTITATATATVTFTLCRSVLEPALSVVSHGSLKLTGIRGQ